MAELEAQAIRTSQYNPGNEIPEKNFYVRLAKKFLFNDFGVYDGYDHSETAAPGLVSANTPMDEAPVPELVQLSVD